MVKTRFILLLAATSLALACQGPSIADGALACAGDGSCPEGFECAADTRCYRYAGVCGDTVLDPGETCDPGGICPQSCSDGNACTVDEMVGSEDACNVKCERRNLTACNDDDQCCPAGCGPDDDNDCLATCGDSEKQPEETCDDSAGVACIVSCDDGDACTVDQVMGSAANCNLSCQYLGIVTCKNDDGCCAPGCSNDTDNDCQDPNLCGNGVQDPGEYCEPDPPGSSGIPVCPQSVADCPDRACKTKTILGTPGTCSARCAYSPISQCSGNAQDQCCPGGCDFSNDADCPMVDPCGNGMLDPGETCDDSSPNPAHACPTVNDCEPMSCMVASLDGPDACHQVCNYTETTICLDGDGCCPAVCQESSSGITGGVGGNALSGKFNDDDCKN